MKLTQKDKEFLETLKQLVETHDLAVELRAGQPSYLVLRGTYGEKIHAAFGLSRQGLRWRFHRLFNDVYVSAFETLLFIEHTFGPRLRQDAVRISRERYALRQRLHEAGFQSASSLYHRRQPAATEPIRHDPQLTRESPSETPPTTTPQHHADTHNPDHEGAVTDNDRPV